MRLAPCAGWNSNDAAVQRSNLMHLRSCPWPPFAAPQIDDPLDAIAVHAGGGMWGMLACAAFAAPNMVRRAGAWEARGLAASLLAAHHAGWISAVESTHMR